jgi:hypothetical protein
MLLDAGTPEPQEVKAYVVLRAISNTAIKPDKLLGEIPCQIDGYDHHHPPETCSGNRAPGSASQTCKPLCDDPRLQPPSPEPR